MRATIVIALATAAMLFELGGLAIVAVGIYRDRRKAQALLSYCAAAPSVWGFDNIDPREKERLARANPEAWKAIEERAQREVPQRQLRGEFVAAIDDRVGMLAGSVNRDVNELKDHLRELLGGSIKGRTAGVFLLALGIVCATAANIVGAFAA